MPTASLYNETELLRKVASGNEAAFAAIFHASRDKLYFFLLKITSSSDVANDMLQDVFIKIWVNRSGLAEVENFSSYLFKMAQNHAYNGMRRMALEKSILAQLKRDAVETGVPAEEELMYKQLKEKLKLAIDSLPSQQKLVYTLAKIEGLKQEEIAAQLNISISTIKNHMTRALKSIREQVGSQFPLSALFIASLLLCCK